MNTFVRVAGITIASVLVVAGTVWAAQMPGTLWTAPTKPFPDQSDIAVPIDTGNIQQDRGGTVDFSKSTVTTTLRLGYDQSIQGDTVLNIIRSSLRITDTNSGIVFPDDTYQISAGKFQNAKLCRVIIQEYFNDPAVGTSLPIYDTIPARDLWTVSDCISYGKSIGPGYPVLIGCEYPTNSAFGAPTAAGYYDKATLPQNCGWDASPPPPPPAGARTLPSGTGCYFRTPDTYKGARCQTP